LRAPSERQTPAPPKARRRILKNGTVYLRIGHIVNNSAALCLYSASYLQGELRFSAPRYLSGSTIKGEVPP
jgi:hypothetical protein